MQMHGQLHGKSWKRHENKTNTFGRNDKSVRMWMVQAGAQMGGHTMQEKCRFTLTRTRSQICDFL